MSHFVHICALIINNRNRRWNSSATASTPVSATSHALFCTFLERSLSASLDSTVKWIINWSLKCIFFFIFLHTFMCTLKWNFRCALKFNSQVLPQVHLFIELFCALLCPSKCTTMRIFKCNSIVASSAPLISTLNTPFYESLCRSQNRY